MGYYWPFIFQDARKYVRGFGSCQWMGQLSSVDEMPLQAQIALEPFEKWGINFIGPIHPTSMNKKHILVCSDFVTKWVEGKAVSFATEKVVVESLFSEIFTRFCVPREIVTNNGP